MQESLNPLNEGQMRVEAMLRKSVAAPAAMDRDGLMFAAGAAAGGRRVWPWRGACAGLLVVCAGLVLFRFEPAVERTVVSHETVLPATVHVETKPLPMDFSAPDSLERVSPGASYLELRNAVLTRGVDVLRCAPSAGSAGGGSNGPALDGLEGVPAWQRRAVLIQGEHS